MMASTNYLVPLSVALAYLCDLHDPVSVCSDKATILSSPQSFKNTGMQHVSGALVVLCLPSCQEIGSLLS